MFLWKAAAVYIENVNFQWYIPCLHLKVDDITF